MTDTPLIQEEWIFAVYAVLMLLAAFGFWSDKTKLGSSISGAAIILGTSMFLSNVVLMPHSAAPYGDVWTYLVPLAVPLLLIKADLRRVISETRGMLIAFFLGAVGTIGGALIGFYLLPLGIGAEKLTGVMSATYIGGSMNFVAVSQAVGLDPAIVTAAVAADNVIGVFYLAFLGLVPSISLFRWWYRTTEDGNLSQTSEMPDEEVVAIDLRQIGLGLGISFAICAIGKATAEYYGLAGFSIIFITGFTLVIANLFPKQLKSLQGDYEIGLFLMYLFFAIIGLGSDVGAMFDHALVIAIFAALIVVCHAVLIFGGSRFFKLDLLEVVIASNACASGPASAAALAAGRGRRDLVAPAVLLGVFGYATANFIGVALASLLGG